MSKTNCNIIKDILPLYVDGVVSDETKSFVEEHLAACPDCVAEAERLEQSIEVPASKKVTFAEVTVIKKAKKKIFNKKVLVALCSLACATALFFGGVYLIFGVRFTVKYDPDTIKLKVAECTDIYGDIDGNIIAPEKAVYATCGLPYAAYASMGGSVNEDHEDVYVFNFSYTLYEKYFEKFFDKEHYDLMLSDEHEYKFLVPTDFVSKIYYTNDLELWSSYPAGDDNDFYENHAIEVWDYTKE